LSGGDESGARTEIRVAGVTFDYRGRRALAGATWSVGPGVTALLGPNGSGKTTLLKCIVGLLQPKDGTVVIGSLSMTDRAVRHRAQRLVGYVPQHPQLPGLSRVEDVIAYAAWLSGVPDRDIPSKLDVALEKLDLGSLRRRRVRTLSGGQRQRVALATGLVHDPVVLVLDEPTVGLDPGQRLKVRHAIQQIGSTHAVILSTHLTEDVQHLAGEVGVLVGGVIRYSGPFSGLGAGAGGGPRSQVPGSDFERAYEGLMVSLGVGDD
jgi:ABC-2 type transport system ATP-binding protein